MANCRSPGFCPRNLAPPILTASPQGSNQGHRPAHSQRMVLQLCLAPGDAVSTIAYGRPFDEFAAWFAEAQQHEPRDANAMTVATATADGVPAARMILLKGVDEKGFVFYTNLDSRKGGEFAANPRAALCFHWKSLLRQVRIEGTVGP